MKTEINFEAVRVGLQKVKESKAAEANLKEGQAELQKAIEAAVRAADPSDTDAVQKLSTDRTRLELYPTKISQQQAATADAAGELKDAIYQAGLALNTRAHEERVRVGEKLTAALSGFIKKESFRVEEIVTQALPFVDSIVEAEAKATSADFRTVHSLTDLPMLLRRASNVLSLES